METFKQALAFPLYLTALWLLWVLGRQLGAGAMTLIAIAGLALIFIYWVSRHSQRVRSLSHGLAILLVGIASWNISQIPPSTSKVADDGIWESFTPQRLSELRQSGQPIFVNMTADWCITCKVNEKVVFTDETLQAMKDKGIALVQGDWTNYDAETNTAYKNR